MNRSPPPLSGNAAARAALGTAVRGLGGRRFAVVDGAHFDNLQRELILRKIEFRPLYLDEKDAPGLASGPHLVPIVHWWQIDDLIELGGPKPTPVFWAWPELGPTTVDAVQRHLRSINLMEIPRGVDDPEAGAKADAHAGPLPAWETVIFRHADPNVLAGVLPLFDKGQIARFLGAASGLCFDAPDYRFETADDASLRVAPRPSDLPPPANGLLRLRHQQYELLSSRQAHVSRIEIMAYLRANAGDDVQHLDDRALYGEVCRIDDAALELGMESGEARGLYCFLAVSTGGASLSSPDMRDGFASSSAAPDDTMRAIFQAMVDEADRDALVG